MKRNDLHYLVFSRTLLYMLQHNFRMTLECLQDDLEHSERIKQAFREHLKSTQRAR